MSALRHWRQESVSVVGGRARNCRAFSHAELALPDAGLVLIAGANNSRKTSLLSALDVIAGDSGDVTSLRHDGAAAESVVTASFALDDEEREFLLARVGADHHLRRDGAFRDFGVPIHSG